MIGYLGGVPDQRNSFLYATIGRPFDSRAAMAWVSSICCSRTVKSSRSKLVTPCARPTRSVRRSRCFLPGSFPNDIVTNASNRWPRKMTDQLVVTSQSGQRIEWSHLSKHEGNLLVGMMGCAIGVATGLALGVAAPQSDRAGFRRQRAALALQFGDARKPAAEEFGRLRFRQRRLQRQPDQLSRPRLRATRTLTAMASGAGIANARTIRDIRRIQQAVGSMRWPRNELAFLVCKVEESLLHREIPGPTPIWRKTSIRSCAISNGPKKK